MSDNSLTERRSKHPIRSEAGVSMMELALILPLVMVLLAGIIDYGFALREVQAVSSAAREGARVAASHARRYFVDDKHRVLCADGKTPASAIRCDTPNSDDLKIVGTDSVANAAKKSTCQSLRNAKLSPTDWDVTAEVPPSVIEDGSRFDVITVKIQKNNKARNCLICWDAMLGALRGNSESTFTLEAACAR